MQLGSFRRALAGSVLLIGVAARATAAGGPLQTLNERLGLELHGFLDLRGGLRTRHDPGQGDTSLAEPRLQLELNRFDDWGTLQLRADFLYDAAAGDLNPDLDRGT